MNLTGVLVIDKPAGITSHDVVMEAKRVIKARKVGHIGTLDPFATGVLPLCIDRATRFARFLEEGPKEYIATMKLGEETDTYDLDGRVMRTGDLTSITEAGIVSAIAGFKGRIVQIPPMFSAVKKDGIPLYKLARKGVVVDRIPREVKIYEAEPKELALPFVTFRVLCSKGTYIRSLCFDIGRKLGCGAHLVTLRRIRCGRFSIADSLPLDSPFLKERILPLEKVFKDIHGVEVDDHTARKIRNGLTPRGIEGLREGEMVRFVSGGRFIALGQYRDNEGFEVVKVV
ncbi:MAG: tRNA pseudouridine(55) synthase TruB [Deltaproteobacteria bacterium]|nr:tRNA pseudouridine(55) synthase TruB [Deltaproteobacteria bacterium]